MEYENSLQNVNRGNLHEIRNCSISLSSTRDGANGPNLRVFSVRKLFQKVSRDWSELSVQAEKPLPDHRAYRSRDDRAVDKQRKPGGAL